MSYDFISDNVESCRDHVTALGQKEAEAKGCWGEEKNQCNREAAKIRLQLFEQTDSPAMYLYMQAVSRANHDPQPASPDAFRSIWQENRIRNKNFPESQLKKWHLKKLFDLLWKELQTPSMDVLPPGSFFIRFHFLLDEPYISRDDNDFYIIENPIRKDKVFRVPFVAPSSWKGNLISALHHLGKRRNHPEIIRLFGNDRLEEDNSKELRRGCLTFFPTFFYDIGLEIINPQSRQRKAGTDPILFEVVPNGSSGVFSLLYVPFHRVGCTEADGTQTNLKTEVAEDLLLVAKGINAMFRTYGFSAKRTSGFGIVEESINGTIGVRFEDSDADEQGGSVAAEVAEPLKPYLEAPDRLKPDYLNPDGTFRYRDKEEFIIPGKKGKTKLNKKAWWSYEKARKWWEKQEEEKAELATGDAVSEQSESAAKLSINRSFTSFSDLVKMTELIAAMLTGGEE